MVLWPVAVCFSNFLFHWSWTSMNCTLETPYYVTSTPDTTQAGYLSHQLWKELNFSLPILSLLPVDVGHLCRLHICVCWWTSVLQFICINNDIVTRFKPQSIHYPVAQKIKNQVLSLHLSGYQIIFCLISELNCRAWLVSTVYQDLIHINSLHILLNCSSHHPLVQKIQNRVLSLHLSGYQIVFRFMSSLHKKSCQQCGKEHTINQCPTTC